MSPARAPVKMKQQLPNYPLLFGVKSFLGCRTSIFEKKPRRRNRVRSHSLTTTNVSLAPLGLPTQHSATHVKFSRYLLYVHKNQKSEDGESIF